MCFFFTDNGKISEQAAKEIKLKTTDALSFDPIYTTSNQDILDSVNAKLAQEIRKTKKQKNELETRKQKAKHYVSETKRRIKGMSNADKISKIAGSVGSAVSGVQKFVTGGTENILSGVVDLASAAGNFLPPPVSLVTDVFSSFLGMFIPMGPTTEEIIEEEFKKQKEFINKKFEEQKMFISAKFDDLQKKLDQTTKEMNDKLTKLSEGITDIADEIKKVIQKLSAGVEDLKRFITIGDLKEIQTQSEAVLAGLDEEKEFLFAIDTKNLTKDDVTQLFNHMDLLDSTEKTVFIRNSFNKRCLTNTYTPDQKADICAVLLYNYISIEEVRYTLMIRFLSLITRSSNNNGKLSDGYWKVFDHRMKNLKLFITKILADTTTQCYFAEHLDIGQTKELNDFISSVDKSFKQKVIEFNSAKYCCKCFKILPLF